MELVSVIVITYNSSKTVVETLDSIKNQTYPNVEIVISDDGSKDDTIEVVEKWIADNDGVNAVIVKAERNQGVPANVNKGVRKCSGNLFKIIAGDDALVENAIERFYDEYKKNDEKTIVYAKTILFGDVGQKVIDFHETSYEKMKSENQYHELLKGNIISAPSVGFLSKKMLDEVGYYDERFRLMEDYPMFIKLCSFGYTFKLIDEPLVRYRVSSSSLSGKKSKAFVHCVVNYFFKVKLRMLIKEKMFGQAIYQIARHCYMYVARK